MAAGRGLEPQWRLAEGWSLHVAHTDTRPRRIQIATTNDMHPSARVDDARMLPARLRRRAETLRPRPLERPSGKVKDVQSGGVRVQVATSEDVPATWHHGQWG